MLEVGILRTLPLKVARRTVSETVFTTNSGEASLVVEAQDGGFHSSRYRRDTVEVQSLTEVRKQQQRMEKRRTY